MWGPVGAWSREKRGFPGYLFSVQEEENCFGSWRLQRDPGGQREVFCGHPGGGLLRHQQSPILLT